MAKEVVILSLGGSLICPDRIDVRFLREFKSLILKHLKRRRFGIITGGGRTAREYARAAKDIAHLNREDQDWLGIHGTRLNAHLIRAIFRDHACARIIKDPTEPLRITEDIFVAAGWKPGCSTDYDAVLLAKNLKVRTVINLSNISHAYDKDPRKHKDAKPLERATWAAFRTIVGNTWDPGLNAPFDPVASRLAQKLGLRVIIADGRDLANLDNILRGKRFRGTVIEG